MADGSNVRLLGVSGSPRRGATSKALEICLAAAATVPGVETACIDLAGKDIPCCKNCNACRTQHLPRCPVFQDDFSDAYLELYRSCDGILLASPLYSMNPTGLLLNFLSRMRPSGGSRRDGSFEGLRVGGCIAVGGRRNGGQDLAVATLNAALQSTGANVVGGGVYFYNGAAVWSKNERDFDDPTGIVELETLGRKVACVASVMKAGRDALGDRLTPAACAGFASDEARRQASELLGLSR